MNGTRHLTPVVASLCFAALACAPSSSSSLPAQPVANPPVVSADAASTPAMPQIAKTPVETIEGRVGEVLSAGHYTYLRLDSADAHETWAVVLGGVEAKVGEPLALTVHGAKSDFHSRRLDRDFHELFFARVAPTG